MWSVFFEGLEFAKVNIDFTKLTTAHGAMKILLTGGTGLLGSEILRAGSSQFEIYAPPHGTVGNAESAEIDLLEPVSLDRAFNRFRPDVVIHTAAETNVDRCEREPERAHRVNVASTEALARLCGRANSKMVFVSTDYVFDGSRGLYSETDKPGPVNNYGVTKLQAERRVAESLLKHLIVRPSVIFGWGGKKENFLRWVLNRLNRGEPIEVPPDHFNSPTLAENLAANILRAVKDDLRGTLHLSGSERISRFDFAVRIARWFGMDSDLIKPLSMSEIKSWVAKRPRDSSLSVGKAEAIGLKSVGVADALESLKEGKH